MRLSIALVWIGIFALVACGDGTPPGPSPQPPVESWYVFPASCSNCPGLVDATIDRSSTPFRARLRVGEKTSLRAVAKAGCGTEQPTLHIERWIPADVTVVRLEASSSESAILTAVAPGTTRVAAERVLEAGGRSLVGLRDPFLPHSGCTAIPELVIEVIP